MPAKSERQRKFMAMCHENPGKGGCPKNMSLKQMHDYMHKPKGGYKRKGG